MVHLDPRLREFATDMRNAPTPSEARLWHHLRGSQLGVKFRRQAVVGSYIADFLCPALGLIVEVDGRTHDAADDALRDAALAIQGYRVLRFSNAAVATDIDCVVNAIFLVAAELPPRYPGRAKPAARENATMTIAPTPPPGRGKRRVSRPSPEGEGRP